MAKKKIDKRTKAYKDLQKDAQSSERKVEGYSDRMERSERRRAHGTVVDHKPASCPSCGFSRSTIDKVERVSAKVTKRLHTCANCNTLYQSLQEHNFLDIREYIDGKQG